MFAIRSQSDKPRQRRDMKRRFIIPALAAILVAFTMAASACDKTNPPGFELDSLAIPPQVITGELVTVAASARNNGGSEGVYTATLKIDGQEIETRDVMVPAGAVETLIFTVTINEVGTYGVQLNGLASVLKVSSVSDLLPEESDEAERMVTLPRN